MTTFYIETFGCSHNFADSEQMAGQLSTAKFEQVDKLELADIIIFNTCTVKGPTADSFFNRLEKVKLENPYKLILIAGCIPQSEPEKLQNYSLIGTKQIHHIVEAVEEALNDNVVKMLSTGEMPPLNLPKIRKNPLVEVIPINRGCLSACTFCKTKQARGNLVSYPIEDIVAVARKGVDEGIQQIWLTSQDTFCYGFDLGTNIAKLLVELVKIPGNFKIRVGMGNPVHMKKIIDELIPILNHAKVFKFIHLPAQSGNDEILKLMRRGNTDGEFRELVKKLKHGVENLTLATDIIVGFPSETEQQYWDTLQLLKDTTPDVVNISRFWPRPGTPAAKMNQLPIEEIMRRSKVCMEIFQNISTLRNERWLGWQGKIVIDERGKFEYQWVGRNDSYKPVIVEGNYTLGDLLDVEVVKTGRFDLRAKLRNN